ncbi:CopG family antitoxin [Desulfonatronospira sp.]|uniref:CopG family antitoxin n=1 Tax=Desulfonatronospira sp. TaxID=1962951 RepID=UPI0025C2618F|nr:CopG family antitoxin [Desulfonatronospira sp.]
MKYELTPEEQEMENSADQLRSVSGEKRQKVEDILGRARKNEVISLRISEADLEMIRNQAAAQGLPYQTFINSILHKYVTGQLYDRQEVRKLLAEIRGT